MVVAVLGNGARVWGLNKTTVILCIAVAVVVVVAVVSVAVVGTEIDV